MPQQRILIVEDKDPVIESFKAAIGNTDISVKLEFAKSIQEAYWAFVKDVKRLSAVIVDFQLGKGSERGSSAQYDGIDLALAFSQIARFHSVDIWIVGYTGSSGPAVESFLKLRETNPEIKGLVLKDLNVDVPGLVLPDDLLIAIQERNLVVLNQWLEKVKSVAGENGGLRQKVTQSWDLSSLSFRHTNQMCPVVDLIEALRPQLLSAYGEVTHIKTREGYSGCHVLFLKAKMNDQTDDRWFAVKVGDAKSEWLLRQEVTNFFTYAENIKGNVPLCFGLFEVNYGQQKFHSVLYELVGLSGAGTMVEHFSRTLENQFAQLSKDPASSKSVLHDQTDKTQADAKSLFNALGEWWHLKKGRPKNTKSLKEWKSPLDMTKLKNAAFSLWNCQHGETFPVRDLGTSSSVLLVNPIYFLETLTPARLAACQRAGVVHGDLHCWNVVRHRENKWMILDFEDVSANALLPIDVAALECDLKFRCLEGTDLESKFRLELLLAEISTDAYVREQATELLKVLKCSAAGMALGDFVHERLVQVRRAAASTLWQQEPSPREREGLLALALLFRSLEMFGYLPRPPAKMQCWLSACLAAGIAQRTLFQTHPYHA
jgi:hypothetical protein